MIYCQTVNVERIAVHPTDDVNKTQFVELIKYGNEPIFGVYIDYDEYECLWEFDLTCPSDYERIKWNVYNAIAECNTMEELIETFIVVFNEYFGELLIENDCDDCENCGRCDGYNGCSRV